ANRKENKISIPSYQRRHMKNEENEKSASFVQEQSKQNPIKKSDQQLMSRHVKQIHNERQQKQSNRNPIELLTDPMIESSDDMEWVQEQQGLLEQALSNFNIAAKVVHVTQRPSVTRFEIQPELGVKVSKIRNLADDLKL